jgi:hypothetical protein
MQRLELAPRPEHGPAPRLRTPGEGSAPHSGVYAELLEQLLAPIQRRRREAQQSLDELARRRALSPRLDGSVASQSPRAQAMQIHDQLARLSLVESLTKRILQPLASGDAPPPTLDPLDGELASQTPWPNSPREETDPRHRANRRTSRAR